MNKKLVRASYEGCLDITARLSAYATSVPFEAALEVNQRQDILATNDLVMFCLQARRLTESTSLRDFVSRITIKASNGTLLPLWKVIGYLIHHDDIEIIRSRTRLRMLKAVLESKTNEERWERIKPELTKKSYSEPVSPLVLFKSDKIPYTQISLVEFVQSFSEKVIPEVIKKAFDSKLYLIDNSFEDLNMSKEEISQVLSRVAAI